MLDRPVQHDQRICISLLEKLKKCKLTLFIYIKLFLILHRTPRNLVNSLKIQEN